MSPRAAVWLIVLLPVLLCLPVLSGRMDADPLVFVGQIGNTAHFPGGYPWIDPNVGFHSQALGKLAGDLWLEGRVPWWNPYTGAGLPLAAEAQPGALFLPFVLLYHYRLGFVWVALLLRILAGLCTYAVLRRLRLGEVAALTAALLYEFNGTFAWHGAPPIGPIAFLPMLLLGVEQLFSRVEQGRPGGWWLIPLSLAWSIYAGFPEVAYIDGVFVGLWALFRLPDLERSRRLAYLGKLAGSALAGLALSLPQVLPFAEYVRLAFVGGHEWYFAHLALPSATAALTLMPGLFGPIFRFNDPAQVIGQAWSNIGGYLTALQLAMVLLAVMLAPRRRIWAPLIWIVLCLGKTYDLRPISDLFNTIPLISMALAQRYAPPSWEFAAVLLIAMGLDAIGRGSVLRGRHIVVAFTATAASALLALWLARDQVGALLRDSAAAPFTYTALAVLLLTLAGGVVLAWQARHRPLFVRLLAALLVLEAVAAFAAPVSRGARHVVHAQPGVDYLREHVGLERVYTTGPLAPNYGAYFKIAQINHNYQPVSSDWLAYIRERLDPEVDPVNFIGGVGEPSGVDSALQHLRDRRTAYEEAGVRYVLASAGTNPFAQLDLLRGDPALHHQALELGEGGSAIIHWQMQGQTQARTLEQIAVLIGNYAGHSDGQLQLRVCIDGGACAVGHAALAGSVDNGYLPVALQPDLLVPASAKGARVPLTITFTHQESRSPVALWLDGLKGPEANTVRLESAPPGVAPSMTLTFLGPESPPTSHRKVYEDDDMVIYELPGARPYFEIIDGSCTVNALTREQVRVACSTPARLLRREAFYPGWTAQVDGQPVALQRARDLFQSVELAPGVHDIHFLYRPTHGRWILAGFAAGLLALLMGLTGELAEMLRGRRAARM